MARTAYGLLAEKNLEDLERRDERIRQYHEEYLEKASLLKQRAEEILNNFDLAESSPKDACQMLRLAKELTGEALSLRDIDKAAIVLFRAGFEISVPAIAYRSSSFYPTYTEYEERYFSVDSWLGIG